MALDGKAPYPFTLRMGLLSEAFNCTPSVAYEEWQRWPVGFLDDVIEALNYRSAKRAVESTTDAKARTALIQRWPLAGEAQTIEYELVHEELNGG